MGEYKDKYGIKDKIHIILKDSNGKIKDERKFNSEKQEVK